MRIVGQIPNPVFTVTIFVMNDKYIVKLEGGPMEQSYKFPIDHFKNIEELEKCLDERFFEKAKEVHNEIFLNWKKTIPQFS